MNNCSNKYNLDPAEILLDTASVYLHNASQFFSKLSTVHMNLPYHLSNEPHPSAKISRRSDNYLADLQPRFLMDCSLTTLF